MNTIEVHRFPGDPPGQAQAIARRKARYGHRRWIVWHLPDGTTATATASAESIALALAEADDMDGRPFVYTVEPSPVIHYTNCNRAQWEIMRQNYANGYI